ncbi:MAG: DUF5103 domain-containing protein, partial [Flammeovirgaceae bacterium]|nr:DUF5103 domain-containing protein [Flammeovirgaceae bacterium]
MLLWQSQHILRMRIVLLLFLNLLFICCVPASQLGTTGLPENSKVLEYEDKSYEAPIKTVRLYSSDIRAGEFRPAVTRNGQWNLLLEFDDLKSERDTYYLRILHCHQDWTASNLRDLDYMTQFNEFPINNFDFSIDTQIPYVHYYITLP